jgi:hypothetical protein
MPARIHPLSLVLGLALGVICLLAMSQVATPSNYRVEYGPLPREMVQIYQGTPVTVPPAKFLVVSGIGSPSVPVGVLTIDGHVEYVVAHNGSNSPSIKPVPHGIAAAPGSVVEVTGASGGGRAWGYFASAAPSQTGTFPIVRVPVDPHPRDMVRIQAGETYIVPAGKMFVLTALGSFAWSGYAVALQVDGQVDCTAPGGNDLSQGSVSEMPIGRTIQAGSVIKVIPARQEAPGCAWGYLSDL